MIMLTFSMLCQSFCDNTDTRQHSENPLFWFSPCKHPTYSLRFFPYTSRVFGMFFAFLYNNFSGFRPFLYICVRFCQGISATILTPPPSKKLSQILNKKAVFAIMTAKTVFFSRNCMLLLNFSRGCFRRGPWGPSRVARCP